MATYDVGPLASQVIGVTGAGISLGILAETSRHVMDTMYGPPRNYSRSSKYRYPKKKRKSRQPRYNPYQPKYRFRF